MTAARPPGGQGLAEMVILTFLLAAALLLLTGAFRTAANAAAERAVRAILLPIP